MKKISLIFAVLAMAMCMSARSYVAMSDPNCMALDEGEAVDTMSYKGFALNETELYLYVGESFQLEVTWDNPEWAAEHSAGVTYSCGSDVDALPQDRRGCSFRSCRSKQ